MACGGPPDCCEETADHSLMGQGSQGLMMRIEMVAATSPNVQQTNYISVTNNCN